MDNSKDKKKGVISPAEDKTTVYTDVDVSDQTVVNSPQPTASAAPMVTPNYPQSADMTGQTGASQTGITGTGITGTGITGATGTGSDWAQPELWSQGMHTPRIEVGAFIKGRFQLVQLLGEGGMGVVYKALDDRKREAGDRDPFVAIKIITEAFSHHPQALKALQRESRKTQKLPHKNIVAVYDFDRDGNRAFMTMELLVGHSLKEVIKANPEGLPPEHAQDIVVGICKALAFAHANNIVHSDLKPGNIFLTTDHTVKVFDFGIARAAKESVDGDGEKTLFDAGELGALTPAYASYEMLNQGVPSVQDDIYALGCITYELYAGRHPFEKVKATKAMEKGLKPVRIKEMNARQWKGLKRGLAFRKDDRTPTADEFLREITAKKSKLPWILTAVILLISLVGILIHEPAMEMYEERQQKKLKAQYVNVIQTGDMNSIKSIVEFINAWESDEAKKSFTVQKSIQGHLIEYFKLQVKEFFDPDRQRFDYGSAVGVIQVMESMFYPLEEVGDIRDNLETRKNDLLSSLTSRFNMYLKQGRILPDQKDEDVFDIMSKVAFIAPENSMLTDKRLESAYVQETEKFIKLGKLDRAQSLVKQGGNLFPDNKAMLNLSGKLDNMLQKEARKERISSLERSLPKMLSASFNSWDLTKIGAQVKLLRELRADHPMLGQINTKVQGAVKGKLVGLIRNRNWSQGEALLTAVADILDEKTQTEMQTAFDKAKGNIEIRVNRIVDQLNQAISDHRLSPPSRDSAREWLARLEKIIPGDIRVQRAHAQIAKAYLALAQKAQADLKWDKARTYLEKASQQKVSSSMQSSIETVASMIKQAEQTHIRAQRVQAEELAQAELEAIRKIQEKKEREQQVRIQTLHKEFEVALAGMSINEAGAQTVLGIMDTLSVLAPNDPLLVSGRERVAHRFFQHAQELKKSDEMEKALGTIRVGLRVIPKDKRLAQLRSDVEKQLDARKLEQRKKTLETYYHSIEALMAAPEVNDTWLKKVQSLIRKGRSLDKNVTWAKEIETRVTTLILSQATLKREQDMFAQAHALLEKTRRFDKRHPGIAVERGLLATAEKGFNERVKKEARMAEIQGLKQTLLTRAQANEVEKAKKLYIQLGKELSVEDSFLDEKALPAIGDAYLRLARKRVAKKDVAGAVQLLKVGLEFASDYAPLKAELKTLEKEAAKILSVQRGKKKEIFISLANQDKLAEAMQMFDSLKVDFSSDDAFITQVAPQALVESCLRVAQSHASRNDLANALKTIDAGLAFQPTDTRLRAALKRYKTPPSAKTKGRSCREKLAGYGRKSRAVCYDMVSDKKRGPSMIVVPGKGNMKSFAIGKYEVSIGQFNTYLKGQGASRTISGDPSLPVTGISIKEAKAYAAWLSSVTGQSYSLPTDDQWVYAATSTGDVEKGNYNCRLSKGGQIIKGHALVNIKAGGQNKWGMKNHIGNAQEFVLTSSGVSVRGGSFKDTMSKCDVSLVRSHSVNGDNITGFRVVRML